MRRILAAAAVCFSTVAFSACSGDRAAGPTMVEDQRIAVLSGTVDLWVGPDGDDSNPGTRESPFHTIQAAIDAAPNGGRTRVKVMGGFYFENLRLRSNVSIRGGFREEEETWNRNPFRSETTIVGAFGQPAILGMEVENVTLKDLVIRSADAVVNTRTDTLSTFQIASYTGPSSVAISLYESRNIVISGNDIRAGDGLDGVNGPDGENGEDGFDGGEGAPGGPADWAVVTALLLLTGEDDLIEVYGWLKTGDAGRFNGGDGGCGVDLSFHARPGMEGGSGESGGAVPGGQGGPGGEGGDNAFFSNGSSGAPGSDGLTGSDGPAGAPFGRIQVGSLGLHRYVPAEGGTGERGGDGSGGGGGGGGAAPGVLFCGSGGGGGGFGGRGGDGGGGGRGGGASIGVLLTQHSEVVLAKNRIRTGDGGDGAATGGSGGAGGAGGLGGGGGVTNRSDPTQTTCIVPFSDWEPRVSCGARGGDGGRGGHGGKGGAGGGGPSVAIVQDERSAVTLEGNRFELGRPGTGGDGTPGGSATHTQLEYSGS